MSEKLMLSGKPVLHMGGAAPRRSARSEGSGVRVWTEELTIPTYLPSAPDKNPMFLERRVYQGSSGRVYPLPFTDRIAEKPIQRKWKAVWIENEFLRALVLPEIGGRIHALEDKTNGYELIYRQRVIKPALVGLAGPWISGGIEFNWPQHHRPGTFLPVDFEVEEHEDGARTIWCSDHEPMGRMKGMHGVRLHPGKAFLELKVRVYNRTPYVQTFLWWANVATRVHEAYQSFFPPDVYYVADHARRSMTEYPLAQGIYYGVNYGQRGRKGVPPGERPSQFVPRWGSDRSSPVSSRPGTPEYAANDLSFYANICTPCSYMCAGSKEDFFGGYDHSARAGIVHVADHHVSPGKKQWTWGNHEFGYAWDRNLTDADENGEYGPYIEIMAGAYTDNQPDFSFLQPGESKTWSQFWYPIQQIGPAQKANLAAAVSLELGKREVKIGVCVTQAFERAVVRLERADGSGAAEWKAELAPGRPFLLDTRQAVRPWATGATVLRVLDGKGEEIISYRPQARVQGKAPRPATEPPLPRDIKSADELYLTGLHLHQYRHATRSPADYWTEALRRDPGDARCNNALGLWRIRRGEFTAAEKLLRAAIERLTARNANPYDGEAYYNLGICIRFQAQAIPAAAIPESRWQEAHDAFYKAAWNQAWAGASHHALAELDCRGGNWARALDHLDRSLRLDTDNLRARSLKILVLRKLGEAHEAKQLLRETQRLDPLDGWTRHLDGKPLDGDLQTRLDICHDYARSGFFDEALALLEGAAAEPRDLPDQNWGALPLVHYTAGWLHCLRNHEKIALAEFRKAEMLPADYCFPARLEEIEILETALRLNPTGARAAYYLGNLLYDKRRHREAIRLWELSASLDPKFSVVWRNLGIGGFNILGKPARARAAYARAVQCNPADARLVYEQDQLWKQSGIPPAKRLRELEKRLYLVQERDDLSVELCALYNQTGAPQKALELLSSRRFQPWEGGEGGASGQYVRAHLRLGKTAQAQGDAETARSHFAAALAIPRTLGEATHPLSNQSEVHYWLGCALAKLGRESEARSYWRLAATTQGDFLEMSVRVFSEMTYYSALAWHRLGQRSKARKLFRELLEHGRQLELSPAKIDYFATSLPTMLLFEDDLQARQETRALFMQAQARIGLGEKARGAALLKRVLRRDPNHALAAEFHEA